MFNEASYYCSLNKLQDRMVLFRYISVSRLPAFIFFYYLYLFHTVTYTSNLCCSFPGNVE